jgi:hypothetical protein
MGPLNVQFAEFQQKYPRATLQQLPDGSAVITIPDIPLNIQRWSKNSTAVHFVAPVGYPAAKPDCFWTDADLRLRDGNIPKNTGNQPLPGSGAPTLWFSWHASSWNANSDNLRTYLRMIQDRLARSE